MILTDMGLLILLNMRQALIPMEHGCGPASSQDRNGIITSCLMTTQHTCAYGILTVSLSDR